MELITRVTHIMQLINMNIILYIEHAECIIVVVRWNMDWRQSK